MKPTGPYAKLGCSMEWWNPYIGCTPARLPDGSPNPSCENCWAKHGEDGRFWHLGRCCVGDELIRWRRHRTVYSNPYFWRGPVRQPQTEWDKPLHWRKPRVIAACFRSDWMHKDIPVDDVEKIIDTMREASHHTYVTTTKRPLRLLGVFSERAARLTRASVSEDYRNFWLGVSAHDQSSADAAWEVLSELAGMGWNTWLSLEPLIAEIRYLDLANDGIEAEHQHIGGVVLGGESGAHARPMQPDWVRAVRDECAAAGVPFTFKQWSSLGIKEGPHKQLMDITIREFLEAYDSSIAQARLAEPHAWSCWLASMLYRAGAAIKAEVERQTADAPKCHNATCQFLDGKYEQNCCVSFQGKPLAADCPDFCHIPKLPPAGLEDAESGLPLLDHRTHCALPWAKPARAGGKENE